MILRCDDCLEELNGDRRYAVLKRVRDLGPDVDAAEVRVLDSMCFDQVLVCPNCAGWYRDPIEVEHV